MSNEKGLSELVEEAVRKGATTAEEIHRDVAALPITMLESLGLPEDASKQVRRIQDESIGAVYDLIRSVNHRVGALAHDLLETDRD